MTRINAEESFEKLKHVDALYRIEEDGEAKPLTVVKNKPKRRFWHRFSFRCTIIGARWEGEPITYSWELYLLPMLRYAYQGHAQYINFRWLIWTIDFRVK